MSIRLALLLSLPLPSCLWGAYWEKTILRSKTAEAIVVPEIGRIMQFGFIGKPGILWNSPELSGESVDPDQSEWKNFGGEKVWPAPEKDWVHFSSRKSWIPPVGFDATPASLSETTANSTSVTWPNDEKTGIRMTRKILLSDSTLTITTIWKRYQPGPSPLSIWTVAQFRNPEKCFIRKTPEGMLPRGIMQFADAMPPSLLELPSAYALTRDPDSAYKIGTGGSDLAWASEDTICHVRIAPSQGTIQPDAGSRVQIYTNADEKPYVELETLGSLAVIPVGSEISETTTYTLHPRSPARNLEATIEKLFKSN